MLLLKNLLACAAAAGALAADNAADEVHDAVAESGVPLTFALGQCYPVHSMKYSVQYSCTGGRFTQKMYSTLDCQGPLFKQMGGPSPFRFLSSVWTCQEGPLCASALKAPGATRCVTTVNKATASMMLLESTEEQLSNGGLVSYAAAEQADEPTFTYATDRCYALGTSGDGAEALASVMYSCTDGQFMQKAFLGADCGGELVSSFGGASPWQYSQAVWTCQDGAAACADALEVEEGAATQCVVATHDHSQEILAKGAPPPMELGPRVGESFLEEEVEEEAIDALSPLKALAFAQAALDIDAPGFDGVPVIHEARGSVEAITFTFATDHCYTLGGGKTVSVKYVCTAGSFEQQAFSGAACAGEPLNTLSGASPWHFGTAAWRCEEGADACADTFEVQNATACVVAKRDDSQGQALVVAQIALDVDAPGFEGVPVLKETRAGTDAISFTFAMGQCYELGIKGTVSVKYACKDGVFTQEAFHGAACTGESFDAMGGASPFHFGKAMWRCKKGADSCSDAFDAKNATNCVVAERDDDQGEALAVAQIALDVDAPGFDGVLVVHEVRGSTEAISFIYATQYCYALGSKGTVSVKYVCAEGHFTQEAFWGAECAGEPLHTFSGESPWKFGMATWTCKEDTKACAGALEAKNATQCVVANRDDSQGHLALAQAALDVDAPGFDETVAMLQVRGSTQAISFTYALGQCYILGGGNKASLKYECHDGVFKQDAYWGAKCTGEPLSQLGGTSPWHFGMATWTCKQGAEACVGAFEAENATECVVASRDDAPKLALAQAALDVDAPGFHGSVAMLQMRGSNQTISFTYATDHCYALGSPAKISVKYTCEDGTFTQKGFWGAECAGEPLSTLDGASPWHFGMATWTCQEDAKACVGAFEAENAAGCVVASRDAPRAAQPPLALAQAALDVDDAPGLESPVALLDVQEMSGETVSFTYATDRCYTLGTGGGQVSVKYVCQDGPVGVVFTQVTFLNAECAGEPVNKLIGDSPYKFAADTWTCKQDAEACSGALEVPGATKCVVASRDE